MVFYRKYRPQKFSDLIGQDSIRETLLAQLTSGKIGHGYLFAGPRGSGKTSAARIFAKAVNCEVYNKKQETRNKRQETKFGEPCNRCSACLAISNGSYLDLIEVDAASNRGIDEIRDLREKIKLSPVAGRFKVYIIDEAHMLTTEAFNALLKTLEEPPAHAVIILCTTSSNKLPPTIISRLSRFNFLKAKDSDLEYAIKKVAGLEKIKIDNPAIGRIIVASDGAYRDALSILDQLAATGHTITEKDVSKTVSAGGFEQTYSFVRLIIKSDLKGLIEIVEKLAGSDADFSVFAKEIVLFLEKLIIFKVGANQVMDDVDPSEKEKMLTLLGDLTLGQLQNLTKLFLLTESEIRLYPLPKIPLILAVCKYCGADRDFENSKNQVESTDGDMTVNHDQKLPPDKEVITGVRPEKQRLHKDKKNTDKSVDAVKEKWGVFLEKVKPFNLHLVALLRSTRPVAFDGANLTLEVFYKFHKDKLEEPKIVSMLEKIMAEVYGQRIVLKLVLAKKESKLPSVVDKSDVIDVSGADLAKIAQEIFSE